MRRVTRTLGRIGVGYVYADWIPQVTYTTPDFNGFTASIGAFTPLDSTGGIYTTTTHHRQRAADGAGSVEVEGQYRAWRGPDRVRRRRLAGA